ncbi:glycosyltransferase family 39 protein [Streptomyces sp. NPDC097619]|uniref:glycosyltransferase family 39 protein n=1 Tax=Streptomyces sp. NPDC097619 TaxID=3157228 RepID=UPI00331E8DFB
MPPLPSAPDRPVPRRPDRWRALAVPLVPAVFLLVLGLWGLSRGHSVWRDEAATWQTALRTVPQIWHMLGQVDAVHGLYYLIMHGLFEVFGDSTTTLRLPSVLAASAAAGLVAVTTARLAGRWAGLAAGLTLALLPAVQFYAQEGRPYALVLAGAAVASWLLVRILGEAAGSGTGGPAPGRAVTWAAYGAALLCCALLNWFSLLVPVAHAVTLAWVRPGRAVVRRWAVAAGAAVVGALPLVLFSRGQSGQVSWIAPTTWHTLIAPVVLLAAGGACALVRPARPGRLTPVSVGLPLLAVPQLGLLAASLVKPLYLDRYVLFSLLGLAVLVGGALGAAVRGTRRRGPRGTAVLVVPVLAGAALLGTLPLERAKREPGSRVDDVVAAASLVGQLKAPGDAVLFLPAARRDTALVCPEEFTGVADIALERSPVVSGTLKGVETDGGPLRARMLARQRILLVTDVSDGVRRSPNARDRVKLRVLAEHFRMLSQEDSRGRRVALYEQVAERSGR